MTTLEPEGVRVGLHVGLTVPACRLEFLCHLVLEGSARLYFRAVEVGARLQPFELQQAVLLRCRKLLSGADTLGDFQDHRGVTASEAAHAGGFDFFVVIFFFHN